MVDEEYDEIYKVVLIGDSGVGKTNILSRYVLDDFTIETKLTVGVEFGSKIVKSGNSSIKIQIWDTAGQERYKSITTTYYKGAKGAFIVYDITKRDSFDNVDKWLDELQTHGDSEVCIILVGNKCDLEEARVVSQEDAINKSKQYNIAFLETSALQAVNIDKIFSLMVEEISNKMKINVENQEGENPEINGNAIDIQKNIHLDDYDKQEETNE